MGASLTQGHAHFSSGVVLWWALANPSWVPNFKFLASAIVYILKWKHKILGSSPSQRPPPLFLWVWFYDGPWQTPAACQIWSRWLHLIRKYMGICFQTTNSLFEPPFGGVRGNIRTSPIAHWKARSWLPIHENWTFLLALTADAQIRRNWLCWKGGSLWGLILGSKVTFTANIYTPILLQLCRWKFSHKETV